MCRSCVEARPHDERECCGVAELLRGAGEDETSPCEHHIRRFMIGAIVQKDEKWCSVRAMRTLAWARCDVRGGDPPVRGARANLAFQRVSNGLWDEAATDAQSGRL